VEIAARMGYSLDASVPLIGSFEFAYSKKSGAPGS
jgi:hypothetical protein